MKKITMLVIIIVATSLIPYKSIGMGNNVTPVICQLCKKCVEVPHQCPNRCPHSQIIARAKSNCLSCIADARKNKNK